MGYLELLVESMKEKGEIEIPLRQKFPQFKFAETADEWLASIKGKTIVKQLRERKVTRVYISAHLTMYSPVCLGELARIGDNLLIGINPQQSLEEKFFTLAHELAHTFEDKSSIQHIFYYLRISGIKNFPKFLTDILQELYHLAERFCDAFAEKWIAINGKEKIALFFENVKPFIKIMEPS